MFEGWSIDYWGGVGWGRGRVHKHFCHISRGWGRDFFPAGLRGGGGGRKKFCTSHENVTGPPPGNK